MNADPLAALKDIYLPAAPQWWPPAPGWWLLALLLLAILYWICTPGAGLLACNPPHSRGKTHCRCLDRR